MDSRTSTFDDYRKQLQMVLEDPSEEPVPVSLDFLKDITDGFSSDRLIGRGGFGEVYKGALGRDKFIAIKKLYAEHVVDDRKYQAELNSLMRIRHQNIVQLIGYCAETKFQAMHQNGEHVLAEVRERLLCFEYISSGSLRDYISDQDLGWDKRYAIMDGICRGLDFLHVECKLTHMDLKPENILMDDDMVPKITDFGLSRLKDAEKTQIVTNNVTGTLGYMPPEYLVEGKISLQTDIYSLGVIACEIITGEKMPFGRSSVSSMKFTKRACRIWMEIFEKSLSDASLKETYIKQVKQLLDIALKCVDRNRMKRPSSSEILQAVFNQNAASSCELNSKYGQVSELLSVHPPCLDFSLIESEKLHRSLPCLLHLTNNIGIPVAFRLLPSETLAVHFSSESGVVPPKCRYTLAVIMHARRNSMVANDGFFTLESTKARVIQGLRFVHDPEEIFKTARERGFKVHEVKLAVACAHAESPVGPNLKPELARGVSWDGLDIKQPGLMIMPFVNPWERKPYHSRDMRVQPTLTEPWILTTRTDSSRNQYFNVWDYHRLEKVHFLFARKRPLKWIPNEDADISYDSDDDDDDGGGLRLPGPPKFISKKRWILASSSRNKYSKSKDNGVFINVYSYMAMKNFKGSKTYVVSKIKSFKAHNNGDNVCLLEVHPSRPYVLSIGGDISEKLKSMNNIKLWDWENGWDCVMTVDTELPNVQHLQFFNPKDQDAFVAISNMNAKVWNIDSPECKSTFSIATTTLTPTGYHFFSTQGGKQYLIAEYAGANQCKIWDYHSGTIVETLKGEKPTSHPELPVLITVSTDRSVLIWSSSMSSLVGVLNCGLGIVRGVAGVKGSGRIVIVHDGIAVAEIGHMLESEGPHESEGSESERPHEQAS